MSKEVKIYGYSDDTVEVLVDGKSLYSVEVFDLENVEIVQLIHGDDVIKVFMFYSGAWDFMLMPEDEVIPDWKITRTYGKDVRYSWTVTIECPDDVEIKLIQE